jgi:hypothetical protein
MFFSIKNKLNANERPARAANKADNNEKRYIHDFEHTIWNIHVAPNQRRLRRKVYGNESQKLNQMPNGKSFASIPIFISETKAIIQLLGFETSTSHLFLGENKFSFPTLYLSNLFRFFCFFSSLLNLLTD